MSPTTAHSIVLLARRHRALTAQPLQALGLESGEDLVLHELWNEEGLTQAELARRVALRRPTVTTVLRTMERRGLVDRMPDARDGRAVRVYPTKRAVALRAVIERIWRSVEAELTTALSGLGNQEAGRAAGAGRPLDRITAFQLSLNFWRKATERRKSEGRCCASGEKPDHTGAGTASAAAG